jgi:hypothetical protein
LTIIPLPDALDAVGLGFISYFRQLIFIHFSVEVGLAVFTGKLVVFIWVVRIFDIKVFATANRAFHCSHLQYFS